MKIEKKSQILHTGHKFSVEEAREMLIKVLRKALKQPFKHINICVEYRGEFSCPQLQAPHHHFFWEASWAVPVDKDNVDKENS